MSHADLNAKITLENHAAEPLRLAQVEVMLTRAGSILRRWMSEERTDGPAAFAPNAIVRFGPDLAERFETTPAAEAPLELIEAARTITRFEAGAPADDEVGQLDDADR